MPSAKGQTEDENFQRLDQQNKFLQRRMNVKNDFYVKIFRQRRRNENGRWKTALTPERVSTKKLHETEAENEHPKKKAGGNPDNTCRKTLFSENPTSTDVTPVDKTETITPTTSKRPRTTNLSTIFVTLKQYVTRKALK